MRDEIMKQVKQGVEERIEKGHIECQAEGCNSNSLTAEVWETDTGDIQGAAVCIECGTQMPVEITGADSISDAADDLQDAIDDFGS